MFRKPISLTFILLASFILFVGSVISHHHHHGVVCLESTHCQSESKSKDHEHDGNKTADLCVLKTAVVLPTHEESESENNNPSALPFDLLFCNLNNAGINAEINDCSQQIFIPEIISSYFSYLISATGLRAPPVF